MSIIGPFVFLLSLLAAEAKPVPKVPLGKETTYVTGPLDKNGFVDYETALNDRLAKGIAPEKNANVLIWQALGPTPEGGAGMPAEYFKRLGIAEPPKKGDYIVGMTAFLRDHLKLEQGAHEAIFDQQARAGQRPWTAKDYPHIAAWLKVNEKPLAVAIEASKRPQYYNPVVSRPSERGPGALICALMPSLQKCREVARLLTCRAMLRVGEGKFDDAWQDLLACHRLARLVGRGASLIDSLVAIALDAIACNADLAYLEHARLTPRQIRDRMKDLRGLPAIPPVADRLDLAERFTYLDSVQVVRGRGIGMMEGLAGGKAEKATKEELKGLGRIDWAPAFRDGNRSYDRLVAALRLKDRAARKKAIDKCEAEVKALREEARDPQNLLVLMMAKNPPEKMEKDVAHAIGKAIGSVLITLLLPAAGKVQDAHDRAEQIQHNVQVAFALGAYRHDQGRYPANLDELAPRYLKTVPGDIFSGKPLIYRPSEKGYLFYSVGVNGKDEGGRWYDDDPPGDDLRVRMPLPELKQKKK
jgi:hypothetical protein